jgi:hypothetical protein
MYRNVIELMVEEFLDIIQYAVLYIVQYAVHVIEEPRLFTVSGLRKPDLVCDKGDRICVVDSQIVSELPWRLPIVTSVVNMKRSQDSMG